MRFACLIAISPLKHHAPELIANSNESTRTVHWHKWSVTSQVTKLGDAWTTHAEIRDAVAIVTNSGSLGSESFSTDRAGFEAFLGTLASQNECPSRLC